MKYLILTVSLITLLATCVIAEDTLKYGYVPVTSWEYSKCRKTEVGSQFSMIVVNGNIVLADNSFDEGDSAHYIRELSPSGKLIRKWGGSKTNAGIVRDKLGNYYVLDMRAGNIRKYGSDRKLIKLLGSKGADEGQMGFATGLAIGPDQTLYVSDKKAKCVLKFSTDGAYLGSFGKDQLDLPLGLVVDARNDIWVADENLLRKFSQSGELINTFQFKIPQLTVQLITTIALSPDGLVYVGVMADPFPMILGLDKNGNLICAGLSAHSP